MSRHSRNNTAHSIFTYHERRLVKDAGTLKERLGSDSMRNFEDCWLCLRPARSPVASSCGFIFCKDCIYANLAEQKIKQRQMKEQWRIYQEGLKKNEIAASARKEEKKLQAFIDAESSGKIDVNSKMYGDLSKKRKRKDEDDWLISTAKHYQIETDKQVLREKSFWVSENTPSANPVTVKEPPKHCVCPVSGKPLKLKELVCLIPEDLSDDSESTKWVCAISKKLLSHQKIVARKSTGQIMLKEYAEKFILKDSKGDGEQVEKRDFLDLISGGTGFSAHNRVESSKFRAALH